MDRSRSVGRMVPAAAAVGVLVASAFVGSAHSRGYASTAITPSLFVCFDEQQQFGLGGTLGGVVATVSSAYDPLGPDTNGTCYRPNHLVANVDGDVTFIVSDAVVSDVGVCVTQDSDLDGIFCNDSGDIQFRFCNSGTVNVNLDPRTGLSLTNAWHFQDAQGVPAWTTILLVVPFVAGSALLGIIEDCGPVHDDYATTGLIGHP